MSFAVSLFVESAEQTARDAALAAAQGAGWIELRLDRAPELGFAAVVRAMPLPVIAACPLASENGHFAGGEGARRARLAAAAAGGAAFLDLPHPGHGEDDPSWWSALPAGGWRAVRSWHEPRGARADLAAVHRALRAAARPGDVVKLVAWAEDEAESWRVNALAAHTAGPPQVVFAQGPGGRPSRLWTLASGAPWSYASLPGRPTAPGQWSAEEMAAALGGQPPAGAPLYAVVGRPVAHSRSPLLWRAALRAAGLPGLYDRVEPPADFAAFLAAHAPPSFRGFSVTAPFKAAALAAADEADESAARVGAANTLQRTARGWKAWNSDGPAALDALLAAGAPAGAPLLVLGAGGAAAAVAAEAVRRGQPVTLAARRPEAAAALADRLGARGAALGEVRAADFPCVVQATPVGGSMKEGNLLAADPPAPGSFVLDMVYQPAATALLRAAAARGAVAVGGAEMLLRQMLAQFRILTGREAEAGPLRRLLLADLAREPRG